MRIAMQVALKRGGVQSKGTSIAVVNPAFVIHAIAGLPSLWLFCWLVCSGFFAGYLYFFFLLYI